VQHRPWPIAIASPRCLLLISMPVLGLRLGFSDESNFAEGTTTRPAYDLTSRGFGPAPTGRCSHRRAVVAAGPPGARRGSTGTLAPPTVSPTWSARCRTPATGDRRGRDHPVIPDHRSAGRGDRHLVRTPLRDDVVPSVTEGTDLVVNVSGSSRRTSTSARTSPSGSRTSSRPCSPVVPAADDGVPLGARAAQGGHHEHALDRWRLRHRRRRVRWGWGASLLNTATARSSRSCR
jgi:hypothetical protein